MKLKADYRIRKQSVAAVKAEELPYIVVEGITKDLAVCPRSQRASFLRRLTPGQRASIALGILLSEIDNGGLHQYYWNSSGDDALTVLEALRLIKAVKYLPIFRSATRVFPNHTV